MVNPLPKVPLWDTHDMDKEGMRHPFKELVDGWVANLQKHADEENAKV